MTRDFRRPLASLALLCTIALAGPFAAADVATFEDLSYTGGAEYENGANLGGGFTSGGLTFGNSYYPSYDGWGGFAYSKVDDKTTPGYMNQYAAVTGTGLGGTGSYGLATGYTDTPLIPGDPGLGDKLQGLPSFAVPVGGQVTGLYVTNTTYAYFSMLQGDDFGAKPFGGADGTAPDFFLLTAYGTDAQGVALAASVEFYLADYRFQDSADDYILTDWAFLDLSTLNGAAQIYFNFTGSQVNQYGLVTPAYVAVDDIQFNLAPSAVPEPASLLACAIGLGIVGGWRRATRRVRA